MNNKKLDYQHYWQKNIEKWGSLYLEYSHANEQLNAAPWWDWLYKKSIYKIEAKLMKRRYQLTIDFINRYVKPGIRFNDIGCGLGLFTLAALKQGAIVHAIDFSEVALTETKKRVEIYAPELLSQVKFYHLNAEQETLPQADVAMAMGVTPYIKDLTFFYKNVLATSDLFYCLIVDADHSINKIRSIFSFLNVRDLMFYNKTQVDSLVTANAADLLSRTSFATGFLDLYQVKRPSFKN